MSELPAEPLSLCCAGKDGLPQPGAFRGLIVLPAHRGIPRNPPEALGDRVGLVCPLLPHDQAVALSWAICHRVTLH